MVKGLILKIESYSQVDYHVKEVLVNYGCINRCGDTLILKGEFLKIAPRGKKKKKKIIV